MKKKKLLKKKRRRSRFYCSRGERREQPFIIDFVNIKRKYFVDLCGFVENFLDKRAPQLKELIILCFVNERIIFHCRIYFT